MADARPSATYQVEPDFAARQSILWSIAWLAGGTLLAAAVHLIGVWPELGSRFGFLTYGRLRGAADTALVFGWLGTAGFAAIFALLPRITEVQLHNEPLGAATSLTWAVVLTGGIGALMIGFNQGRPLGELGVAADVGMLLMLVMVFFNAVTTVVRRREKTLYPSGWFLLVAASLAPLIFVAGNLPVFTGVTDSLLSGFYLNGIEMLWLLPIALGIAHYVIPVETGNALYSVSLARTTFWSLVFAGGWAGQRFYLKGPAPDYIDTIAVAMTGVLLIPVLSAAANLYATGRGRFDLATRAFGLRFAATGLGMAGAWISLVVLATIPSINRYVGLTAWQTGIRHFAIFGVFSSFAFALIYHAYPLMVGRDWASKTLASIHFWTTLVTTLVGTAFYFAIGTAEAAVPAGTPLPGIVSLLRMGVTASLFVLAGAQFVFAYNTFRTSRSGPYVVPLADPQILQGAR